MEPLQQNFEIVIFISEDFTKQKFFRPPQRVKELGTDPKKQ